MVTDYRQHCCVRCTEQPVLARVIDLLPARFALVHTGTDLEEVSLSATDARIGDVVLIHAGEVVAPAARPGQRRLSPASAGATPSR